jgi:thiamine transport system permease protein
MTPVRRAERPNRGLKASKLTVRNPGFAALVPVVFLGVLVVWPLMAVLVRSLAGVGPERLADILGRRSTRSILWFTIWQAAASAALTLVLGLPIAHALARYRFWGRAAVRAIAVVPFVLPTVVVAAAIDASFEALSIDLDRSVGAILVAHVFFNIAIVIRVVGGRWASLDRRPEEAAMVLGASSWNAFRLTTLPRLLPVIASAGILTFLFSFTSFGVILILGGPTNATIETEIYRNAVFRQEFDVAAVLALVQIVVVAMLSLASTRLQRRFSRQERGRRRAYDRPIRSAAERRHVIGIIGLVAIVVGGPLAALVAASLRTGDGGFGLTNYRNLVEPVNLLPVSAAEAVGTSLRYGTVAAIIAVLVGVTTAFVVTRTGLVGRSLEVAALIPLGVSAVTLGFGYLLAFTVLDLRRSTWIVPIAHAVVGLPFVLASVVPALRAIDHRYREAASVLGATPSLVVRLIDLPLIRRAALTGGGFAFAVSLGEFGATSFLARSDGAFTAPLAIFRLLSQPGDLLRGRALALSVVMGTLVAIVAAAAEWRRDDSIVSL